MSHERGKYIKCNDWKIYEGEVQIDYGVAFKTSILVQLDMSFGSNFGHLSILHLEGS